MLIVEMWGLHNVWEGKENTYYECSKWFWEESLEIAREYGWIPMGTLPFRRSLEKYIKLGRFESNYNPEEHCYAKMILEKDAKALGEALERALADDKLPERLSKVKKFPLLLKEKTTVDGIIDANRGITPGHIREFTDFVKIGGFGFAWDD